MKIYKMQKSIKDYVMYAVILALLLSAWYVTKGQLLSVPVKAIFWIVSLLICSALAFFTVSGKKFIIFASEAKGELQKVVWPTRQETIQTTSIVIAMVIITGFVLWGVDSGMMWVIAKITHLG